jgi:hypothetical protein
MAESEVEAAWRAALERIGEKQSDDALHSSAPKKDVAFHWLGDEVEARRLSRNQWSELGTDRPIGGIRGPEHIKSGPKITVFARANRR